MHANFSFYKVLLCSVKFKLGLSGISINQSEKLSKKDTGKILKIRHIVSRHSQAFKIGQFWSSEYTKKKPI